MALLGNIIWFIFVGWWNFLLYGFAGLLWCITIIGIPIGKALFQYAKLMALPFGKVIVKETELKGKENVSAIRRVGGTIANIIWLPIGIILFILNIGTMIACAITIIGIPVAVVIAKSCKFLIWPVGAKVITKEEWETLKMERTMMKVAGTAMAVNNMMYNQSVQQQMPQAVPMAQMAQPQQQAPQSGQTFENLRAGGTQALESIKETGGKAMSAIATTGGKAMSAIAETGSAGASALKNRQTAMREQILAGQNDIPMDELLTLTEAKLYRNKIMAWIMPFLEYITLAVGVISVIVGIVFVRYRFLLEYSVGIFRGGRLHVLVGGIFYGIVLAAPLMILAAVLGMIKRNQVFVLIVLGAQLVSHIGLGFLKMGFSVLWIVFYIAMIAGYVYLSVMKNNAGQQQTAVWSGMQGTVSGTAFGTGSNVAAPNTEAVPSAKKFCSQCGADVSGGIAFCGKCGAKVK